MIGIDVIGELFGAFETILKSEIMRFGAFCRCRKANAVCTNKLFPPTGGRMTQFQFFRGHLYPAQIRTERIDRA